MLHPDCLADQKHSGSMHQQPTISMTANSNTLCSQQLLQQLKYLCTGLAHEYVEYACEGQAAPHKPAHAETLPLAWPARLFWRRHRLQSGPGSGHCRTWRRGSEASDIQTTIPTLERHRKTAEAAVSPQICILQA